MTHPANSDLLIHDLFLQQASQAPERPAVISSGRTLSYADLRVLSSSLGYRLRSIGVQPNTLVAVVMEKGWEQIVAVMGTLSRVQLICQSMRMSPQNACIFCWRMGKFKSY